MCKFIKCESLVIFLLIFFLPGICVSIDEKSIIPLIVSLAIAVCFFLIYRTVSFVKARRLNKRFSGLSPDALATLFKDFSNQAKWDPEASRALKELLDREKK
jgi:hypothetical protein